MSDASLNLYASQWSAFVLYLVAASSFLYWAYKKPKAQRARAVGMVTAIALLALLPGNYVLRAMEQERSRADFEKYREAAWAHFRKRCKEDAGEKIYRVVEGVEGIFLRKPRNRSHIAPWLSIC
jgi:hypothetical protein